MQVAESLSKYIVDAHSKQYGRFFVPSKQTLQVKILLHYLHYGKHLAHNPKILSMR